MRTDLLLRMVDLLEEDANNPTGVQFDLDSWGITPIENKPDVSCGTQACAMGLAALSGAFKDEGLEYTYFPNYNKTKWLLVPQYNKNKTNYSSGFGAAAHLFDISRNDAEWLFAPTNYKGGVFGSVVGGVVGADGERQVANRIREYITSKESLV